MTLIFEVVETSSRSAHKASVLLDQLFEAEAWMQVGTALLPVGVVGPASREQAWECAPSGRAALQLTGTLSLHIHCCRPPSLSHQLQERLLPGDLQQRVRRFYAEIWAPSEGGQQCGASVAPEQRLGSGLPLSCCTICPPRSVVWGQRVWLRCSQLPLCLDRHNTCSLRSRQ